MNFTNYAMLGGLGAAIAAGWSQVKTVFSYISSFVIVRDSIESALFASYVTYYLRANWGRVPSGKMHYMVPRITFLDGADHYVPFQVPPANSIFYKKGTVISCTFNDSGSTMTLTSIRGTFDAKSFLETVIKYAETHMTSYAVHNRFYVEQFKGKERTSNVGSAIPNQHNSLPGVGGSLIEIFNTTTDKSFMYDSSLWLSGVETKTSALDNYYYPPEVERHFAQATQWLKMREWYRQRAIPWRRGWLLYGAPGTGKSSLARALGMHLGLPIFQYFLSTMSDQEFIEFWSSMSTPCIALLEDIDTVFHGRENITAHKSLSFDCLLNMLNGISTTQGVFTIASANELEYVDPALGAEVDSTGIATRPGRIDTVIHVGNLCELGRQKIAKRILCDWPEDIQAVVDAGDNMTPAQFQELCLQRAYTRINAVNICIAS